MSRLLRYVSAPEGDLLLMKYIRPVRTTGSFNFCNPTVSAVLAALTINFMFGEKYQQQILSAHLNKEFNIGNVLSNR